MTRVLGGQTATTPCVGLLHERVTQNGWYNSATNWLEKRTVINNLTGFIRHCDYRTNLGQVLGAPASDEGCCMKIIWPRRFPSCRSSQLRGQASFSTLRAEPDRQTRLGQAATTGP